MTDWADEEAVNLLQMLMTGDQDTPLVIATALRKARSDALEEAAKVADETFHKPVLVDRMPATYANAKHGAGTIIATAIRALIDKQPAEERDGWNYR